MPALAEDAIVALARRYAAQAGIPASMAYAMIQAESTGNSSAVHGGSGARGLMQLLGPAAKEQGFTHDDMMNPEKNVKAGTGYIGRMLHRFKDPGRALSAYNAGPGETRKHDDLAPAAEPYVQKVASLVKGLTKPGGEFADEMDPESAPSPAFLQKQKVKKTIDELLQRVPQPHPPQLMEDDAPSYDKAGIRQMLSSTLNFGQ